MKLSVVEEFFDITTVFFYSSPVLTMFLWDWITGVLGYLGKDQYVVSIGSFLFRQGIAQCFFSRA